MGQLLTANVAGNLYWFGRHLERIESTLKDINALFDIVIDTDKSAGTAHYERLGVDLTYTSASTFLTNAVFGDHAANLRQVMENARENVIICRSQIDAEAFGEVIKLHEFFSSGDHTLHGIDYRFADTALSLINEIWGALSCGIEHRLSDAFINLGKLVEKTDLNLRHNRNEEQTKSMLNDIVYTTQVLSPDLEIAFDPDDLLANMEPVNALITKIIVE